jgi:uncharacterized Zn finger protein
MALSNCPNCGANWTKTELIAEANRGGGYRVECHECGHKWDDPQESHHERETARKEMMRKEH